MREYAEYQSEARFNAVNATWRRWSLLPHMKNHGSWDDPGEPYTQTWESWDPTSPEFATIEDLTAFCERFAEVPAVALPALAVWSDRPQT